MHEKQRKITNLDLLFKYNSKIQVQGSLITILMRV